MDPAHPCPSPAACAPSSSQSLLPPKELSPLEQGSWPGANSAPSGSFQDSWASPRDWTSWVWTSDFPSSPPAKVEKPQGTAVGVPLPAQGRAGQSKEGVAAIVHNAPFPHLPQSLPAPSWFRFSVFYEPPKLSLNPESRCLAQLWVGGTSLHCLRSQWDSPGSLTVSLGLVELRMTTMGPSYLAREEPDSGAPLSRICPGHG